MNGAPGGGCAALPIGGGGVSNCPGDQVPSVILTVNSAQNQPLAAANIVFSVNGGASFGGVCDGSCNATTLALDTLGTFNIQVGAVGYSPASKNVTVVADSGGCHPVTQNVTITLQLDISVGVLSGSWITSGAFGETILRFSPTGEIIGAILLDRTIAGDGNFYVAYNGKKIRGVTGQTILAATATEPTRSNNIFNFRTTNLSIPVGFENAAMSGDFQKLTGTLQGAPVTATRLGLTPNALLEP
jgi:hypothetical protein